MQSNSDIYVIVQHWLTQRCPRQYRAGDGLYIEVAMHIYEFHEQRPGLDWSFDSLDAALADYVINSRTNADGVFARAENKEVAQHLCQRVDVVNGDWGNAVVTDIAQERDEIKAQDCVFLWSCGVRVDD